MGSPDNKPVAEAPRSSCGERLSGAIRAGGRDGQRTGAQAETVPQLGSQHGSRVPWCVRAVAVLVISVLMAGCGTGAADDQQIAFMDSRGLFLMGADGSNQRLLFSPSDWDDRVSRPYIPAGFTFSPRGDRIAYSDRYDVLHVVRADGTGNRVLVRDARYPSWSPNGDLIAFTRTDFGVWVIRPDGTDERVLIGDAMDFAWSPDGREMVFSRPPFDPFLYIQRLEDGTRRRLTTDPGRSYLPAWSPGSKIAFVRFNLGEAEIFVIDPDGKNERQLTHNDYEDGTPAWSYDGSRIAFTTDVLDDLPPSVVVFDMNADGSRLKRLTKVGPLEPGGPPVWKPPTPSASPTP